LRAKETINENWPVYGSVPTGFIAAHLAWATDVCRE
jgi:hypothetical protein